MRDTSQVILVLMIPVLSMCHVWGLKKRDKDIIICETIITNIARVLTDRYGSLKGSIYIYKLVNERKMGGP